MLRPNPIQNTHDNPNPNQTRVRDRVGSRLWRAESSRFRQRSFFETAAAGFWQLEGETIFVLVSVDTGAFAIEPYPTKKSMEESMQTKSDTTLSNQPPSSNQYGSFWQRALYDSPLHTLWGKIALVVIFAIIASFALPIWVGWLTPIENGLVLLYGILLAFLGCLVLLAVLRYLDRREPEPWFFYVGALFIAVLITTAPAAWFNTYSPLTALTVGFNEEFWKAVPLLLLILFFPTMVSGVRDGIIYGAIGGIGFNIVEIATYILRISFPESGLAGANAQLVRLGFFGVGNHVLWSMFVGAGIGLAVQSPNRRTKILAPLGAYLLASVVHDLNDTVGVIVVVLMEGLVLQLQGVDVNQLRQGANDVSGLLQSSSNIAFPLSMLVMNIVVIPLLIYALWKSGDWERQVVRDELKDEVGTAVTPEEYQGVLNEKRFHLRALPGYNAARGRAIRNAQNSLAFFKLYLQHKNRPVEGNSLVAYWHNEIARLRKV